MPLPRSFAIATTVGLCTVVAATPHRAPRASVSARDAVPATPRAAPRGRVVADTLWSQALGVRKQFLVYLPPSYDRAPARRYPVAYYLHGLWGSETDWMRQGRLAATADSLAATRPRAGTRAAEVIVVTPDGDDGWYTTWNALSDGERCRRDTVRKEPAASYCVPWPHYDDYVARDLVARVDSAYRTLADRRHRGIAGLSMGGYGALSLALRYPDVFGAAASHSGVAAPLYLGPRPYAAPARWAADVDSVRARWGGTWTTIGTAFGRDTAAWWARDPGRLAARVLAERPALLPALFIDVGTADRLVDQNRALHAVLDSLRVPHAYAQWPGGHTWDYWRAHVGESLAWLATHIAPPTQPAPPAQRRRAGGARP